MNETRIYASRRTAIVALAIGLVLGIAAVSFDFLGSWFLFAVCAAVVIVNAIALVDRRVKLGLSADGVRCARWGGSTIPWQEFSGYRWVSYRNSPLLQLVPRRPSELARSLPWYGKLNHHASRLIRMPTFAIQVATLDVGDAELTRAMAAYLPEEPAV